LRKLHVYHESAHLLDAIKATTSRDINTVALGEQFNKTTTNCGRAKLSGLAGMLL
jgi:hypothetical protein